MILSAIEFWPEDREVILQNLMDRASQVFKCGDWWTIREAMPSPFHTIGRQAMAICQEHPATKKTMSAEQFLSKPLGYDVVCGVYIRARGVKS